MIWQPKGLSIRWSDTVGMGFIAAILSSVMNNLPTVLINALAIQGTQAEEIFVKP